MWQNDCLYTKCSEFGVPELTRQGREIVRTMVGTYVIGRYVEIPSHIHSNGH
jgi:hypothetical protein